MADHALTFSQRLSRASRRTAELYAAHGVRATAAAIARKAWRVFLDFLWRGLGAAARLVLPERHLWNLNYGEAPEYARLEEKPCIRPDKERIRGFKDKHKGRRCFIVGNGPSLNRADLRKLDGEYTFGVNSIFHKTREIGFRPHYYVVEDCHVMEDNLSDIDAFEVPGHKFFPTEFKDRIRNRKSTSFFRMNFGFYQGSSPKYCIPHFSTDCSERIYCGQTVTYMNLQLAYYMGFTDVYLIGMDFSYVVPPSAIVTGNTIESTEDDPNHFHPDYFGKGKKWHDPKLDRVLLSYRMAKLIYECSGRRILNATIGGKLELFDRVDFDSLF